MTGVFDIMTPAQRLETAIRKNLEARRDSFAPRPGYYYRGAGDLLLRHGSFFQGRELPEAYRHLFQVDGGMGNCFRNAYYAARQDPTLRYFEGVYATGSGHFTPHAWCVSLDGGLLELTMPSDPASLEGAIEARSMQPMLSPEHWGYWGVQLQLDYVAAVGEADGCYGGTLDRPVHDALFSESADMDVEERREHWPIFTYPFDPNRSTP